MNQGSASQYDESKRNQLYFTEKSGIFFSDKKNSERSDFK
jgi:hypothetical protein